jgi:hypothetical protein
MTVDSKDNAYAAALAWATHFFRWAKGHGFLGKGFPEWIYDTAAQLEIRSRDEWEKNNPGVFFPFLSSATSTKSVKALREIGVFGVAESEPEMDNFLRRLSAVLIEKGEKLPQPLAEFAAASLREPNPPGRPARKASDLLIRDVCIGMAVDHIIDTWGFSRTRNRFSKKKVDCSASIVSEALAEVKIGLSEDEVIKASNRRRRLRRLAKPIMSEKVVAAITTPLKDRAVDELGSAELSNVMRDAAIGATGEMASEMTKFASSLMSNPADHRGMIGEWVGRVKDRKPEIFQQADGDFVEEIVARIERRKPEFLKLTKRPWITDDRRK